MSNVFKIPQTFTWHGKPSSQLTRDELEQAFIELSRMYQGALIELGKRRKVQLVPVEVVDNSPAVIVSMLSAMVLMSVLIAVVAVVL